MATKKTKKSTKPSKVKKAVKKIVKEVVWQDGAVGKYTLTIYMNDEVFVTKTDDVYKSLSNFTPTKITNRVRIVLEKGDKSAEKMLMVIPARRTFGSPIARDFVAKNLTSRV